MIELFLNKKIVRHKLVFIIKHKSYETIERYKVRLIFKDYTQTYIIDYQEIFAPMAKMSVVRVIFSHVINLD